MIRIDNQQRRWRLANRHRLTAQTRSDDPLAVATSLVALHSSDPTTVFLTVTARQAEPSLERVEASLYEERSLLRHHAMRRTIWVMPIETAVDAHSSSTRKIARAEKKRTATGADWAEEWIDERIAELREFLVSNGPATTRTIGELLPHLSENIVLGANTRQPANVGGHSRLLLLAAFEAEIARGRPAGSWISSGYEWWPTTDWLGRTISGGETRQGAARMTRRWLDAFGPGTETDLRWWTGWTATAVRHALADLDAVEVELDDGGVGWINAADAKPDPDPGPWLALLPGLDPTAMGWKERSWYLADDVTAEVTDRNGNIGPTVWVDGEVVGGWLQRPDGSIAVEFYRPISKPHLAMIDVERARLIELLDETRFRVRFPSRNQPRLLGEE